MLSIEITNGTTRSLYAEHKTRTEVWGVRERVQATATVSLMTAEHIVDRVRWYLANGYTRFALHLEDNILVCPEPRTLVSFDCLTGKCHRAVLTEAQLDAIVALAIGGDEIANAEHCYEIAEEAVAGWPVEYRSIP